MIHLLNAVLEEVIVRDITDGKAEEYQHKKNSGYEEFRRKYEQTIDFKQKEQSEK